MEMSRLAAGFDCKKPDARVGGKALRGLFHLSYESLASSRSNIASRSCASGREGIGWDDRGAAGDDLNGDWRNYHAYNVWAAINHRFDLDVIPAGFQTYFSPLIYYPVYLLRRLLSPLWTGLIVGAIHGLNLVAVYSLTRALLGAGLQEKLPGGIWELDLRGTSIRKELLDPYGLVIDGSRSCLEIAAADTGSVIEACTQQSACRARVRLEDVETD